MAQEKAVVPPRKVGAPRGNKNRKGKRTVERDRIDIHTSISKGNGLLPLFEQYLGNQGMVGTDEEIRNAASDKIYFLLGEWLKREIELQEQNIPY